MMRPQVVDLFGEVPVTAEDVAAWLEAVPRISPDSPRAEHYIRAYDVPGKIQAAKRSGLFDALVNRPPPPPYWWQRFRWG